MRALEIEYEKADGSVSARTLVDYHFELGTFAPGVGYLNCRDAGVDDMRTYRVDRILSACYLDTGEVIAPWLIDNPAGEIPARLALRPFAAAILQLQGFVRSTRGFRAREAARFDDFVREIGAAVMHQHPCRADEFVVAARCLEEAAAGREIPVEQVAICRRHALRIAAGSGRKPVPDEWLATIDELWPQVSL